VTLHRFGLTEHRTKRASALSTGLRLRFEIARILLTDPDLIILDEPLANLDVVAQQNLLGDLQALAASVQRPRAIVISSQHIGEIEAISDRIIVLSGGAPLFVGYKDEISSKLRVNVFELVGDDKRALVAAGRKLNPIDVVEMGISTVVIFPIGVTKETVLAHMSANGVNVTGFNDLSNSAKALLYLDKLLADGRIGPRARTS
jgi:ABC-2 type transport system ATP-binding protein